MIFEIINGKAVIVDKIFRKRGKLYTSNFLGYHTIQITKDNYKKSFSKIVEEIAKKLEMNNGFLEIYIAYDFNIEKE